MDVLDEFAEPLVERDRPRWRLVISCALEVVALEDDDRQRSAGVPFPPPPPPFPPPPGDGRWSPHVLAHL